MGADLLNLRWRYHRHDGMAYMQVQVVIPGFESNDFMVYRGLAGRWKISRMYRDDHWYLFYQSDWPAGDPQKLLNMRIYICSAYVGSDVFIVADATESGQFAIPHLRQSLRFLAVDYYRTRCGIIDRYRHWILYRTGTNPVKFIVNQLMVTS